MKSVLDAHNGSNTITSFEQAVEHYSKPAIVGEELQSVQLIDVMKADPDFLTLRDGHHLTKAKQSILSALDHALHLIQSTQNTAGGDSDSAFYVKENELAELNDTKQELLSVYNNLSDSYHPEILIDGKSGRDWYSIQATPGKTIIFNDMSTFRTPTICMTKALY